MKTLYLIFISLSLWSLTCTSYASSGEKLSTQLAQCGKITSADKRLACFDGLLEKKLVTQVPAVKAPAQPVQSKEVDGFAKEHIKKTPEESGPESITSKVTKLKKLIRGQWVLNLANGQQWQQKDEVKFKIKVGDTVRLKKGAMGAVFLNKEGSRRNIRVKRLK
ncbi:MAG: hypothetical protein OQK09_03945 [Colwellia sp.]|nr:hypothetical protein [Colwellia sp.]MCW9080640.1 hypothetical protein [Colwellia sp.]